MTPRKARSTGRLGDAAAELQGEAHGLVARAHGVTSTSFSSCECVGITTHTSEHLDLLHRSSASTFTSVALARAHTLVDGSTLACCTTFRTQCIERSECFSTSFDERIRGREHALDMRHRRCARAHTLSVDSDDAHACAS